MNRWKFALALLLCLFMATPVAAETGGKGPSDATATEGPVFVIEPRFSHAFPFREGLAAVVTDGKIGFIDRNGTVVIAPAFEDRQATAAESGLYVFSEGLALIRENGKYGYIDKKGTIIIEPKYDRAFPFRQGLAAVVTGDRVGYVDRTGRMAIPQQYHFDPLLTGDPSFFDGRAKVVKKSGSAVTQGFIDKTGREVIPLQAWSVEPFSDGLALVRDDTGDKRELYYIDPDGNRKVELGDRYSQAHRFYSGMARVERDGRIGYINRNGREIIAPSYTYALNFSEERALAKIGTDFVLIDKSGGASEPLAYNYVEKFSDGLAMVVRTELTFADGKIVRESKTGYIDYAGKAVIAPRFEKGQGFSEGLAAVRVDGLWGYIAKPSAALPSTWAQAELAEAAVLGLIPEGLDGHYREPAKRADFAKLAVHLLTKARGQSVDELLRDRQVTVDRSAFRDTRDETVLAAHALGIISGRGNGIFDPEGAINRQEAALMLAQTARLLDLQPTGEPIRFADEGDIAPWAADAVKTVSAVFDPVKEAAVMTGVGNGRFAPRATYENQQALITMKRLYQAHMQHSGE